MTENKAKRKIAVATPAATREERSRRSKPRTVDRVHVPANGTAIDPGISTFCHNVVGQISAPDTARTASRRLCGLAWRQFALGDEHHTGPPTLMTDIQPVTHVGRATSSPPMGKRTPGARKAQSMAPSKCAQGAFRSGLMDRQMRPAGRTPQWSPTAAPCRLAFAGLMTYNRNLERWDEMEYRRGIPRLMDTPLPD